MATRSVAAGGTITLRDLTVHRLDFGAMRMVMRSSADGINLGSA
jgi:hypothetical protein